MGLRVTNCIEGHKHKTDWVMPPIEPMDALPECFSGSSPAWKIRNQGGSPYCVGFAVSTVFEDTDQCRGKELSPVWIYDHAFPYDICGGTVGASISGACEALRKIGAVTTKGLTKLGEYNLNLSRFKILSYYRIDYNRIDELKTLVMQGKVLCSFESDPWLRWLSSVGLESAVRRDVRGHAISLVGFRECDGILYWEFENSWGRDWGVDGRCFIPHKEVLKMAKNRPAYILITNTDYMQELKRRYKNMSHISKGLFKLSNWWKTLRGRL